MNRLVPRAVFVLGAAVAFWVAWHGADQLLQAFRIIPRLGDVSAPVWVLLAATFASIVLSLVAILMAWRAMQAHRLKRLLIWAVVGAAVSPALVEGAGALASWMG